MRRDMLGGSRGNEYRATFARCAAIGASMATLFGAAAVLARFELDPNTSAGAIETNAAALTHWWIASACVWAALSMLAIVLHAQRRTLGWCVRCGAVVLLVAAAARVAVLLTHEPTLSDDVHRYVMDGAHTAGGVNPYMIAPIETDSPLRESVNHPELHTIYLPTSQWVFAAAAAIVREAEPHAQVRFFRAVFALLDMLTVALVLAALARRGRSPWWAALYAWHPLPLTEFAGSGHQDVIGIVLMLTALLAFDRQPRATSRWAIPLAAAALVKPVVFVVTALMLRDRPARDWLRCMAISGATMALIATPLLLSHEARPLANLTATAERFASTWAHFGLPHEAIAHALAWLRGHDQPAAEDQQASRWLLLAIALVALAFIWWRSRQSHDETASVAPSDGVWSGSKSALFVMLILSPVVHPWYLLWALVLVPVSFGPAVWVASLTLPWGYVALVDASGWEVPTWIVVSAYAPIAAAGLAGFIAARRGAAREPVQVLEEA